MKLTDIFSESFLDSLPFVSRKKYNEAISVLATTDEAFQGLARWAQSAEILEEFARGIGVHDIQRYCMSGGAHGYKPSIELERATAAWAQMGFRFELLNPPVGTKDFGPTDPDIVGKYRDPAAEKPSQKAPAAYEMTQAQAPEVFREVNRDEYDGKGTDPLPGDITFDNGSDADDYDDDPMGDDSAFRER